MTIDEAKQKVAKANGYETWQKLVEAPNENLEDRHDEVTFTYGHSKWNDGMDMFIRGMILLGKIRPEILDMSAKKLLDYMEKSPPPKPEFQP